MATKYPLVDAVNFSTMEHSEPKKTQGGAGVAFCYSRKSKSNRDPITFQLVKPNPMLLMDETPKATRDELLQALPWVRSPFHLSKDPKFEVTNGKHTVLLGITKAQLAQLSRLDDANVGAVVSNSQAWFKRGNLSPELVRAQHNTVISRYPATDEVPENEKTTVVRTKIVEGKTQILVQNPDKLQSFQQGDITDIRVGARVVPVLQDYGIYFRATESGGQLQVKRILVMHGDEVEGNADFDCGDVEIEIEEDFVPPTNTGPAMTAAEAVAQTTSGGHEGDFMDTDASATEHTVINAYGTGDPMMNAF